MIPRKPRTAITIAVAVMLLVGSIFSSNTLHIWQKAKRHIHPQMMHVPMGGMEPLVADIMWMRLIQYLGSGASQDERVMVRKAYGKFDTITRLDPRFRVVYKHGVLFFMVSSPEKALHLLDRAMTHIPPRRMDWRLPFYGAFISYQFSDSADRFDRSLKYLSRVESMQGCPSFVRRFKPHVLQKKGEKLRALEVWFGLYEGCETAVDRAIIRRHVRETARDLLENSEDAQVRDRAREMLRHLEVPAAPSPESVGGT